MRGGAASSASTSLSAHLLAWLAAALPLLVLVAVAVHGIWGAAGGEVAALRDLATSLELGHLTLTPSAVAPREGPGSHPAVVPRHTPRLPSVDPGPVSALLPEAGR